MLWLTHTHGSDRRKHMVLTDTYTWLWLTQLGPSVVVCNFQQPVFAKVNKCCFVHPGLRAVVPYLPAAWEPPPQSTRSCSRSVGRHARCKEEKWNMYTCTCTQVVITHLKHWSWARLFSSGLGQKFGFVNCNLFNHQIINLPFGELQGPVQSLALPGAKLTSKFTFKLSSL